MKYELFDPSAPCNPLLPLNPVTQKLTFYKINVFEKTISLQNHKRDEKADPIAPFGSNFPKRYRLGILLSDIFPQIRENLKVRFVSDGTIQPVLLGVENTYFPAKKDYTPDPKAKEIIVNKKDLEKGFIKIGRKKVEIKEFYNDLSNHRAVDLNLNGKALKLATIPETVTVPLHRIVNGSVRTMFGNVKLGPKKVAELASNGRTSVTFKKEPLEIRATVNSLALNSADPNLFYWLDPSEVENDELYFEVLGELLDDPRSGMSDQGQNNLHLDISKLPNDAYKTTLESYLKDPRYSSYASHVVKDLQPKLPRYEIGLFTTFEQTWELMGYSRGSLLSSLTLAPNEELSIEIFTFDKTKIEEERTSTVEFESNIETSALTRASAKISRDLSETTDTNADLKVGIPLPVEGVPIDVDAGAGASGQVKSGIQTTIDQINESTTRSAEKFKSTTQVKIVQTHEFGEERRTIRKIRNPNLTRTLTFNHFEILETYKVSTRLKDTKQFCLLVENPDLGNFDIDFVLAFEDRLQKALLSPNYKAGFEGAKKLAAQRWFEKKSECKVEIDITNDQNGGADPAQSGVFPKPIITIAKSLRKKLNAFIEVDLLKAAGVLAKHYDPFLAKEDKPSKKKVSSAEDALGLFNFWFKFKLVNPGIETKAIEFLENVRDNSNETTVVEQLQLFLVGMDDEWLTSLKMLAANLVALQLAAILTVPFAILVPVLFELALIDNSNGLPALIEKAKKELAAYEIATSAKTTLADATGATATTVPQQPPPPQVFTLEDLALANAEFEKLALHLQANKTYYSNQIWLNEDPNARLERLRIKGIFHYVENRLLGFVGDKSVYPLRLDALDSFARKEIERQIANFRPDRDQTIDGKDVPKITDRIETLSLPTAGVYMESMLGKCSSCEPFIEQHRAYDLQLKAEEVALAVEKTRQARAEADRLVARLTQTPPLLDDPDPENQVLRIALENTTAVTPPPGP